MESYPSLLPFPSQEGFSARFANDLKFQQMDDGSRKPIAKRGAQALEYELSFAMSEPQLEYFEAWWKYTLNMGAKSFQLEVLPGQIEELRVTAPYKVTAASPWKVSFTVQVVWGSPTVAVKSSLPEWPFGGLERQGYSYVQYGAISTTVEGGKVETRERFTQHHADFQGSIIIDLQGLKDFFVFIKDTLVGGLGWFLMPITSGHGTQFVRTTLTSFEVSSLRGAFQVKLEFTTFNTPIMGPAQYSYPNGVQVSENMMLREQLSTLKAKVVSVVESLKLVGVLAQKFFLSGIMRLDEKFKTNFTRPVSSFLLLVEALLQRGEVNPFEEQQLKETVSVQIKRPIGENFKLVESVKADSQYIRTVSENVTLKPEASWFLESKQPENVRAVESGKVIFQNYATGYFGDDYTGSVVTF